VNGEATFQIRRDMDATRAEMDRTIGALQRKLSPDTLKQQAKDAAYDAARGKAESMVRSIKANPFPLAMAALGVGWIVMRGRASTRPAQITVAPSRVDRALETIGDKAQDLKLRAGDAADEMKVRVSEVADEARMQGRRAADTIETKFHENPLAIGLGVVAAGVILGLAIPITSKEDEWMGAARDKLASKAEEAAHEALGKVDELAQRGVAKVNEQLQPAPAPTNGITPTPTT
jgi:ElaB/YqjD/DUF883 family membrane-anchored ribosome-binding protein